MTEIETETTIDFAPMVANGVRYLDIVLPEWRTEVNWSLVAQPGGMCYPDTCVFGQVAAIVLTRRDAADDAASPHRWHDATWFARLLAMLPGMTLCGPSVLNAWAAEHGFYTPDEQGADVLGQEWLKHAPAAETV